MTSSLQESFIKIIRLGIGHQTEALSSPVNWDELQTLAERQGLSAVLVDGIEQLPDSQRPPKDVLLQMIGQVVQGYELRYESYRRAIAELASFYTKHDLKMMVLKGYACSLGWPKSEHRPCGDIDIWLFGKQREGDEALLKANTNRTKVQLDGPEGKVNNTNHFEIDKSHHHHTVFDWKGFTVENHYDFVNVHAHKSSAELEKVFKELGEDDSHFVEISDTATGSVIKVYMPSPNLHALFLIKHMVSHFAAAEISLRQVLDWAFFAGKHTKEIDWVWLDEMLEKYSMKDLFNCINGICVEDLGFAPEIFPSVQFLPDLKEKVLDDILEPEFGAAEPAGLLSRLAYRYRRWQGNAWKQELCYNESRWEYFWYGIWAKMLKPASF